MAKKEIKYETEREYLGRISAEELLRRIIRIHLNRETQKEKGE